MTARSLVYSTCTVSIHARYSVDVWLMKFHIFMLSSVTMMWCNMWVSYVQGFLDLLPQLLQTQFSYEKPLVTNGDQLVHSSFLRSLTSITLGLKLIDALCLEPRPIHELVSSSRYHIWCHWASTITLIFIYIKRCASKNKMFWCLCQYLFPLIWCCYS